MPNYAQSVISIWIPNQGEVPQGKYCLLNGKKSFVANMTKAKEWIKFTGYSISKRLLDELPTGTQIIYKREDLNSYYLSTKTNFYKHGILVSYGGHSQFILPIKDWTAKEGKLQGEPKNLPVMSLDKWLKSGVQVEEQTSKRLYTWADLGKVFKEKYTNQENVCPEVENRKAVEPLGSQAY